MTEVFGIKCKVVCCEMVIISTRLTLHNLITPARALILPLSMALTITYRVPLALMHVQYNLVCAQVE